MGEWGENGVIFLLFLSSDSSRSVSDCYNSSCLRRSLWQTSDPDATYGLAKFWHAQKAKFREKFEFKSDTAVVSFIFTFSPPLFFPLLFFSFAGHFVGFISLGKEFRKAFRCKER